MKVGGCGKVGGVKVVKMLVDVEELLKGIFGFEIKGLIVKCVMVVVGVDIKEEYYFLVLLDWVNCSYFSLLSFEGGMEIEEFVVECFEVLVCVEVNFEDGFDFEKVKVIVVVVNFLVELVDKVVLVFVKFYEVYVGEDVMFVEVNLLVFIGVGDIVVFDGKVLLDENVEFWYLEYEEFVD